MIKRPWAQAEIEYIVKRMKKGDSPQSFIQEFNKKFKTTRTIDAVTMKGWRVLRDTKSGVFSKRTTAKDIAAQVEQDFTHQRSQAEVNLLKQKYKHALRDRDLQDTILALAENCIKTLPVVPPPKPFPRNTDPASEEDLVLLLSDIHAGEVVSAEELNDLNEYNFDICSQRLKYLSDSIRDITKNKLNGYKFRKLVIFGLGDWVSGMIHEELLEGQNGNIVDWTVNLAYILSQMFTELLTDFEAIEFVGIVGNHGRMHKKPRFKARYVNWDYICYQLLSMFLANQKRIKFTIPKSFWTLYEVNGHNFLLLHGDNIKSNLGIPWYGVQRIIANLKELLEAKDQRFTYVCLGHFHNRGLLDRVKGELMINGSVIGGNEFSVGRMFTSSEACQHFFGVHKKKGTTFSFKLKLQHLPLGMPERPYKYAESSPLGSLVNLLE